MKRRCLLVRRWRWFALLLVPFLTWGLVLAIVPTDWARARVVEKWSKATGRSVRIGAIRLGLMGELQIVGLSIAERATPESPWLEVDEAKIDVRLGQVLAGQCEPKEIALQGVSLRVWRKEDGSLEIGDLLRDGSGSARGRPKGVSGEPAGSIALKVSDSKVRVVDDSSGTLLELSEVRGQGTWGRRIASIDDLRGRINGGTIELAAKLDRDPGAPRFEAEVRARGVEVDRGMPALGFFVPVVAGSTDGVGGKFDLVLALQGRGTTRDEIRETLQGTGSVVLDPVDLEGSKFLDQLDVLGDWPKESRIGSVSTDFKVEHARITTDDLTIRASRFPFVLGGWTDFDGRFDYSARVDRIAEKLPKEAKGWLPEMKASFDQLAGLRMRGSIDRVEVTIHGHPLTGDPDRPDGERARFRDTARKIRDRFFR